MKRNLLCAGLIALSFTSFATFAATGKEIYGKYCHTCHAPNVAKALKAPALHNQEDWQARFDKALAAVKKAHPKLTEKELKAKALDHLVDHVKKGLGAMPAGGMCPKCTDDEYKAAIEFMMSKKKKN